MAEKFDAIILGLRPGGEVVASRLLSAGKKVAVVKKELLGGKCAYWACIPSKTLIRPPEVRNEATRAQGTPTLDLKDSFDYRDHIIRNLDGSGEVESYQEKGAKVVKGEGRLDGPGRIEVNGEAQEAEHVVVATGSATSMLPIEGALGRARVNEPRGDYYTRSAREGGNHRWPQRDRDEPVALPLGEQHNPRSEPRQAPRPRRSEGWGYYPGDPRRRGGRCLDGP